MLALLEYESHICKRCGTHDSVAEHPEDHHYVPDEKRCPICAGLDVHARVVKELDETAVKRLGENPDPKAPRPADGRTLLLRPATPEEREAHRRRQQEQPDASPVRQTRGSAPAKRRRSGGGLRGTPGG